MKASDIILEAAAPAKLTNWYFSHIPFKFNLNYY